MRISLLFATILLTYVTCGAGLNIASFGRRKTKPPTTTTEAPSEDMDGKKFDLDKDGETVTCGYSERQKYDPDGKPYPGYKQCGARVRKASDKLANPGGSGTRTSGGIGAASAGGRSEPPPEDPNSPPEDDDGPDRKKRDTAHAGTSECTEKCFWVQPFWIYWKKAWWPVVQTPKFKQWLKYCFCSPVNQTCMHYFEDNSPNPYPMFIRPRIALCARCTTEWGWRHIWVWWKCNPIRIWVQIPVGCCCGLKGAHYCQTFHQPKDFTLPPGLYLP